MGRRLQVGMTAMLVWVAVEARAQAGGLEVEAADERSAVSLTGSVVLASNYLARGVSLTSHRPAVQVSLTLSHESGVYVTGWGSNTRFGESRSEIDLGVGYARDLGNITLDVGYLHYFYPDDDYDGDSSEVYAVLSRPVGAGLLKAGLYYSSNTPYAASSLYPFAEVRVQAPTQLPLTLTARVGRLAYRKGAAAPFQNYTHWSLTASAPWKGYDLSVGYADTDIRHDGAPRWGRGGVLVMIGRSF